MTRPTGQDGLTNTPRSVGWRVVTMVRICVLLLGVVVAATAPADVARGSSDPVLVSDAEIAAGHLGDELLATGLVERTTREHLASRDKGYLPADALSPIQMDAVRQIAERHGLLYEQAGADERPASLRVGIWHTWEAYVSMHGNGKVSWLKLDMPPRPPTVEAMARQPLPDSVLRSSGPHPLAGSGVKAALRSLEAMARQGNEADGVGWHFHDLPLLYRNWIEEEWQRTVELESGAQPPSIRTDGTDVFWAKAILVSIMSQEESGGGRGVEIAVPAF